MESALSAFAVEATVTPPAGDHVTARVFWLPPQMVQSPPGSDVKVVEQVRVLVLNRSECGSVPRGTIVSIPEYDGAAASEWRVDSVDSTQYDHIRAVVVPNVDEA